MSFFLVGPQTQSAVSICTQTVSTASENCSSRPNAVHSKNNPPGTIESPCKQLLSTFYFCSCSIFPHKNPRPGFGYLLQQNTGVCLCKRLKCPMNLMPKIFHCIPLRVAAVFHARKHALKVRRLFFFFVVAVICPELVLLLTCLTRAVHPLPVCISDSLPANSKAATRSCCSHHRGSTDTGHLAFSNPNWTVTFPKILVCTTVPRSVYIQWSGINLRC